MRVFTTGNGRDGEDEAGGALPQLTGVTAFYSTATPYAIGTAPNPTNVTVQQSIAIPSTDPAFGDVSCARFSRARITKGRIV